MVLIGPRHFARPYRETAIRQRAADAAADGLLARTLPWLRLGLGSLVERPPWVRALPAPGQPLVVDQYRDARLWLAARRGGSAIGDATGSAGAGPQRIGCPVLVLGTTETACDPALRREVTGAAHHVDFRILPDESAAVLVDRRAAYRLADLVAEFAAGSDRPADVASNRASMRRPRGGGHA